jgi:hypothetical protein
MEQGWLPAANRDEDEERRRRVGYAAPMGEDRELTAGKGRRIPPENITKVLTNLKIVTKRSSRPVWRGATP